MSREVCASAREGLGSRAVLEPLQPRSVWEGGIRLPCSCHNTAMLATVSIEIRLAGAGHEKDP